MMSEQSVCGNARQCYLTMLEKGANVRKLGYDVTKQDPHKQRLLWVLLFCLIKYNNKRKTESTLALGNVMIYALA